MSVSEQLFMDKSFEQYRYYQFCMANTFEAKQPCRHSAAYGEEVQRKTPRFEERIKPKTHDKRKRKRKEKRSSKCVKKLIVHVLNNLFWFCSRICEMFCEVASSDH